jgi:hypothetical protein
VVITPSLERDWVRPVAALRSRGISCVAIVFDTEAYSRYHRDDELRRHGLPPITPDPGLVESIGARRRALRHALAEYDLPVHEIHPGRPLAEELVS